MTNPLSSQQEGALQQLVTQVAALQTQIAELKAERAQLLGAMQQLLGLRFVRNGEHISLMVAKPQTDGRHGLIADMLHKLTTLWSRYGGTIIIP